MVGLVGLVLLAVPAQAQVVIRERVELQQDPAPADSAAMTPAQAATTNPYTFTAPASGLLQVRYVRAQRKVAYAEGAPSLAGYTLEVDYRIDPDSTSAFETIIDDIQSPPVPAKMASTTYTAGPRFEAESVFTHCRAGGGGGYICAWQTRWEQQFVDEYDIGGDQWYEYNQEDYILHDEAEPVLLLGSVEAGEQIDLELRYREADGTAHPMSIFWDVPSDELREGEVWGKEADYKGAPFTFLGGRTELLLVYVVIKEPTIQFLRQDDSKIPLEEDDADESVLMVSKFRTDDRLDGSVPFLSNNYESVAEDGRDPTVGDKFTFRPQVIGLEAGENVEFNVEVVRGDSAVYQEIFQAIGDSLDAGTSEAPYAYRGTQHLRLVSNATHADAPFGAQYDDEYRGRQTIRAELEDTVRVSLILNGDTTTTQAVRMVGRPASESGPYAIRRAELNWMTYEDVESAPDVITDRMSEDWAQAGVYFRKIGEGTFGTLDGVISVRTRRDCGFLNLGVCSPVPEADTLRFTAQLGGGAPQDIVVPYQQGDVIGEIAFQVREALVNALGLQETEIFFAPSPDDERKFFIYASFSIEIHFADHASSEAVELDDGNLNFENLQSDFELNIVGVGTKDSLDQSIDVIVLPDRSLPGDPGEIPGGKAGSDLHGLQGATGLQNTIFLTETAADLTDDLPLVAGHEAGHVLFDREFPGDHPIDSDGDPDLGHSIHPQNLMYWQMDVNQPEQYDGPKRLTWEQNSDARCDSAPPTDDLDGCNGDTVNPPLLLPKSKSDQ